MILTTVLPPEAMVAGGIGLDGWPGGLKRPRRSAQASVRDRRAGQVHGGERADSGLAVEQVTDAPEPDVLRLAAEVYAGLSDEDVAEIEKIATERGSFFTR